MFRTQATRVRRYGRLTGAAFVALGLLLTGATAAQADTRNAGLPHCQDMPQPSLMFERCMAIYDTDLLSRMDGYDGNGKKSPCVGVITDADALARCSIATGEWDPARHERALANLGSGAPSCDAVDILSDKFGWQQCRMLDLNAGFPPLPGAPDAPKPPRTSAPAPEPKVAPKAPTKASAKKPTTKKAPAKKPVKKTTSKAVKR